MSYLKLWSLLSSSALISAHHADELWRHICWQKCSQHELKRRSHWTGTNVSSARQNMQVNHVSDVNKPKNIPVFLHLLSLLSITIICTMKWEAALYQCIYKYEFWDVFIWARDDELITVSSILLTTMMNNAWMYKNYTVSYNFFQKQRQNSRRFPVFPEVVKPCPVCTPQGKTRQLINLLISAALLLTAENGGIRHKPVERHVWRWLHWGTWHSILDRSHAKMR